MSPFVFTSALLAAEGGATSIVVAALGGAGLSAIVAAVVSGLFSKRKLGAEATEIITKAAAGVVTNIQSELDRQVAKNQRVVESHAQEMSSASTKMQGMERDHAREMEEVRRVLQLHVAWDAIAIAKMSELGVQLPPAPPLLPPLRHEHR